MGSKTLLSLSKYLVDKSRLCLSLRGEALIARAHRQPRGLTYDRAGDKGKIKLALGDHTSDDENLLIVLFAKIGTGRAHQAKEFFYDGSHSIEVTWAGASFHDFVQSMKVIAL